MERADQPAAESGSRVNAYELAARSAQALVDALAKAERHGYLVTLRGAPIFGSIQVTLGRHVKAVHPALKDQKFMETRLIRIDQMAEHGIADPLAYTIETMILRAEDEIMRWRERMTEKYLNG